MKNSIEEDMKSINKGLYELEDSYELHQARWAKRIFENIKEKLDHILSAYKRILKENEELKEYIAIAPNLDEMTATKYRNIQQDAYIRGRAEEQKKAGQIIYENYIPIQKVKDKIEELDNQQKQWLEDRELKASNREIIFARDVLQELLVSN